MQVCKCRPAEMATVAAAKTTDRMLFLLCQAQLPGLLANEPRHQPPRNSSGHPTVCSPTHVFATKHHTPSSNLGAATAQWRW